MGIRSSRKGEPVASNTGRRSEFSSWYMPTQRCRGWSVADVPNPTDDVSRVSTRPIGDDHAPTSIVSDARGKPGPVGRISRAIVRPARISLEYVDGGAACEVHPSYIAVARVAMHRERFVRTERGSLLETFFQHP